MKTYPITRKLIATTSIVGLLLLTGACAERTVRPEHGHPYHHRHGHAGMPLEQAVE